MVGQQRSTSGPGGLINQATDPGGGAAHNPQTTSYPVTVNITDPKFISLTNLTVTMNLQQAALGEIRVGSDRARRHEREPFPEPDQRRGHDPDPPRRSGSRAPTWVSPPTDGWARSSMIAQPGASPTGARRLHSSAPSGPKGALSVFDGRVRGTAQRAPGACQITDFRATAPPRPPRRPTSSSTGHSTSPRDSRIVADSQVARPRSSGPSPGTSPGPRPRQGHRASARGSRSPRTIPWARSALTRAGSMWLMSTTSISRTDPAQASTTRRTIPTSSWPTPTTAVSQLGQPGPG